MAIADDAQTLAGNADALAAQAHDLADAIAAAAPAPAPVPSPAPAAGDRAPATLSDTDLGDRIDGDIAELVSRLEAPKPAPVATPVAPPADASTSTSATDSSTPAPDPEAPPAFADNGAPQ